MSFLSLCLKTFRALQALDSLGNVSQRGVSFVLFGNTFVHFSTVRTSYNLSRPIEPSCCLCNAVVWVSSIC